MKDTSVKKSHPAAKYFIKNIWLVFLCAVIGFGIGAWVYQDTYTSSGTMYIDDDSFYSGEMVAGGVTLQSINLAESLKASLIEKYTKFIKSDAILDQIAQRIVEQGYNDVSKNYIKRAIVKLEYEPASYIIRVTCRTNDPQLSQAICEAVLDTAPHTLKEISGPGENRKISHANLPTVPDGSSSPEQDDADTISIHMRIRTAGFGALIGGAVSLVVLLFLTRRAWKLYNWM